MARTSTDGVPDLEALDDALLLRVAEFEAQLEAWGSERVGIPLLVLPEAPPPVLGRCVSCGEAASGWRCSLCLEAAALVLELADLEGERLVPPRSTVHAAVAEIEENLR